MRYCIKCGIRLPEEESAKFCPNCGASLAMQQPYERPREPSLEPRVGFKVATLRSRILVMLMTFILCLAVTASGAMSKIEPSEAQGITGEVNNTREMLSTMGVQLIFGNNLMYCIMMFVPLLGPYYGSLVLYSTGRAIAALSVTARVNPLTLFATLFFYPHTWLEFVSYSLAISESFWLIYAVIRYRGRGLRNELPTATKIIAICAVLLLLAAYAEMYIISSAS
jgi:uncharacterized membrane protein SpoIIM required for sporulation